LRSMASGWSSTGAQARSFRTVTRSSAPRREYDKLLSEPKPQPDKRPLKNGAADVQVVVAREELGVSVIHAHSTPKARDPGASECPPFERSEQVYRLRRERVEPVEEVEPGPVVAVVQLESNSQPGVHHQPLVLDEAIGPRHVADPQLVAAAAVEALGIVFPVGLQAEPGVGVEDQPQANASQAVEVASHFA